MSNIYVVGGPVVITSSLEDELGESYNVVRLWGMTRYGTAVEVAKYFWDESQKAVLVWDGLSAPHLGNSEMVSQAKELAIEEESPLLLINKNYIPEQVESVLQNLSVQEVILVGNVDERVTTALEDLGISISEQIKGDTPNETRSLLKQKLKQRIRVRIMGSGNVPLVVVAVGNWTDEIKAPYMPNGTSRHISSEEQIDDLISEINDNNYSRIAIVGKPDLAQTIYDRLTDEGIYSTLISGRPDVVARRVMQREKAAIRIKAVLANESLRRMFSARINANNVEALSLRIIEGAGANLDRIGIANKTRILNELNSLRDRITEALEQNDTQQAWLLHTKIQSNAARLVWTYREKLVERYQTLTDAETRYRIVQRSTAR